MTDHLSCWRDFIPHTQSWILCKSRMIGRKHKRGGSRKGRCGDDIVLTACTCLTRSNLRRRIHDRLKHLIGHAGYVFTAPLHAIFGSFEPDEISWYRHYKPTSSRMQTALQLGQRGI